MYKRQLLLQASNVTMRFGGLTAVNDVSLNVHAGEIVGLIGPNGAGKTTFFNCLTGLYKPTSGEVRFAGEVLPPKPRLVVRRGMARTFQNIRLFHNMTALETVSYTHLDAYKRQVPFPSIAGISGEIVQLGNVTIQMPALFTVAALAVSTVFLWFFVNRSKTGRAMVATSQDPDTARLMGINVDKVIVAAFAVGAGLAAIAGVAHGLSSVSYTHLDVYKRQTAARPKRSTTGGRAWSRRWLISPTMSARIR